MPRQRGSQPAVVRIWIARPVPWRWLAARSARRSSSCPAAVVPVLALCPGGRGSSRPGGGPLAAPRPDSRTRNRSFLGVRIRIRSRSAVAASASIASPAFASCSGGRAPDLCVLGSHAPGGAHARPMTRSLDPTAAPVARAPVGHAPVSCGTRSLSLGKSSILDRLGPISGAETEISYFF
jgi:hypothetical protein